MKHLTITASIVLCSLVSGLHGMGRAPGYTVAYSLDEEGILDFTWPVQPAVRSWNIYLGTKKNGMYFLLNDVPIKGQRYVVRGKGLGLKVKKKYYVSVVPVVEGREVSSGERIKVAAVPAVTRTPTVRPTKKPTRTPRPTRVQDTPTDEATRQPSLTRTPTEVPTPTKKPTLTELPTLTSTPTIVLKGPELIAQGRGIIKLQWQLQAGVDGWNVYLSNEKNGEYLKVNDRILKRISYQIDAPELGLIAGEYYYVKVSSIRGGEESDLSAPHRVLAIPKR